jgi:hypothetical protein
MEAKILFPLCKGLRLAAYASEKGLRLACLAGESIPGGEILLNS